MIWVWGFISDYFQTRWIPVVIQASIGLIPGIIMSIWNVSDNAKYFSCGSMFLPPPSPSPHHSITVSKNELIVLTQLD